MNLRFQNALAGVTQATPPIWFMRQAGRYHRHYQKLRREHGFMELCKNPRLAAEVALGPIEDFDFDLAILFSDLLFPLEALGMGLDYNSGPPRLGFSLDHSTLQKLCSIDEALPRLAFQKEAMQLTRQALPASKSLIGFVGGPWTLLGYAVDGSHNGGLSRTRQLAPTLAAPFFETLVPLLEQNIALQLEGGAEAVMILDTAAGELPLSEFKAWAFEAVARLTARFPGRVGYYMRGASEEHWDAVRQAQVPFAGIGFDSGVSLLRALSLRTSGFIQGNFDQHHLTLEPGDFRRELVRYLDPLTRLSEKERAGWICGIGHGATPLSREENVRSFVRTVREIFA